MARSLRKHVPQLEDCVGLTTIPIVADVTGAVPLSRWVYYCVDDFSQWPGLDSQTLAEMERQLVSKVDRVVAAGDVLKEHVRQLGREASVITHGIDLSHWATQPPVDCPQAMADLPRPIILFWGLIDQRLDIDFLTTLGERLTAGCIALIGPQQDVHPALAAIPRLHCVGPLSYQQLPAAAACASVLVMPYADLPVTRAMQPLKLKEYLAAGKPVVARLLPAVEPWQDALDAVQTAEQFATVVMNRLSGDLPQNQHLARNRLNAEDWQSKARSLWQVLFQ